jgi:hypothetical protein
MGHAPELDSPRAVPNPQKKSGTEKLPVPPDSFSNDG